MRARGGNRFNRTWWRTLRSTCALAALTTALGAISAEGAPPTYWRDLRIEQNRPSGVQGELRNILQSQRENSFASMSDSVRRQLLSFYEEREFRPVWSGGPSEQERAEQAFAALMRADDQGLRSQDYLSPKFDWSTRPTQREEAAEYDIALTDAVLRYARDVAIGRVRPNDVYRDAQLPAPDFNPVDELRRMLRRGSISASLADLPPPHPEYRRLAEAMARYRAIEAQGGWPSVGRGEIAIEANDRRTKALTARLAAEDPALAAITDPSTRDIEEAVRRFQSRNDLEPDGRVTGATLTALNVPLPRRMEVLVANMERWRWLPRRFEDRYIAVNVPDQSVAFMRNGDVALSSRVVVGRKTSPTPILRTNAIALIVNPPWEVPGDIVINQILPKLRRSSGYLQASNMVLVNAPSDPFGRKVNWRNVSPSTFPYRVVQIPGPHNALGHLMIDTPNDFDVYLHDTPGKALFKSDDRAVSNGCIRVEGILQLAALALDEGDAEASITQKIAARDTQRVQLNRPLPVYFLYWTAIATPDGTVGFRRDLYGRDARLITALAAPAVERRAPPSGTESNTVELATGSTRVSDTLLPAEIEADADNERGSEVPPLDEQGSEIPPLPETESVTQTEGVAEAVRRANGRTEFTESVRRSEADRTSVSAPVTRRTWPNEDVRYGRSRRTTDADRPFPVLRRLFEGDRSQNPYRANRDRYGVR
jgi:murein L,D-transpeptidase YcbB/YkuD